MKKYSYENFTFVIMFAVMSFFFLIMVNQLVMNKTNNRNYNDFYGEHSMKISVITNDALFSFVPDAFGDNFVIYNTLLDREGDYTNDRVRVVFGKGDYPVPSLKQGSFFTYEQLVSDKPVCVAGSLAVERNGRTENGKLYYRYGNTEYEVIGIIGTESPSDLDIIVMLGWGGYYSYGVYGAKYLIDAYSENNITDVYTALTEVLEAAINDGTKLEYRNIYYHNSIRSFDSFAAYIYLGAILIFTVNIMITSLNYTDKRKYRIAVKKMLGASQLSMFGEICGSFIVNACLGFVLTVVSVFLLNVYEPFSESEFGYFTVLSLPTATLALASVILLAVAFSLPPVIKAFRTDISYAVKH